MIAIENNNQHLFLYFFVEKRQRLKQRFTVVESTETYFYLSIKNGQI